MINKGKVISLKSVKNINFFSKNKHLLLICCVFLIGVFSSILLYKSFSLPWQVVFNRLYLLRGKLSFLKSCALSFGLSATVIAVIFIFGTSMMGQGIIPCINYLIGYFMGSVSAYLYTTYSLKGVAFNLLLIIPSGFIFILLSFFAAKSAMEYSINLSKLATKKAPVPGGIIQFKNYARLFLILIIISAVSSIIETLIIKLFLGFFNF